MKSIENIIAATDLSEASINAIDRAVMIAAFFKAKLQLIHVQDPSVIESLNRLISAYPGSDVASIEQIDNQRIIELESHLAERHLKTFQMPRVRKISGPVVKTLLSEADAQIADLIVVGAQGESRMPYSPLGSISSRLLRKSEHYPVLLVKEAPTRNYQRIIIGVDFSPVSMSLVDMAKRLAPKAELILLHAFDLPYEVKLSVAGLHKDDINQVISDEQAYRRELLMNFVQVSALDGKGVKSLVVHSAPARGICNAAKEFSCDLVVVGKHGSSMIEEFFIGSVTKHLLNELDQDILVITDSHLPSQ